MKSKEPIRDTKTIKTVVLVVGIGLAAICLLGSISLSRKIDSTQDQVTNLSIKQSQMSDRSTGVVIDPIASVVYIPELRIKLPYNVVTKTIQYSPRMDQKGAETEELDVSSAKYIAPEKMTRVNCSDLVRLKVEAQPSPYNPNEKATSVNLVDGRTLQIYEAINQDECTDSWSTTISPSTLASEFKQAQSY